MTSTTTTQRDTLLQELRDALRTYLQEQGGTAASAQAVHQVALEQNADPSQVTAAMWTLIDEGTAQYGSDSDLTLT